MELQDQKQEQNKELDLQTQVQRLEELELSETWRQLLGLASQTEQGEERQGEVPTPAEPVVIEPLPNDPWSELVQTRGTEVIDLQRLHASHEPLSEQDVEQALQAIQEQPAHSAQHQTTQAGDQPAEGES
ncbi:hypothetical protein [Thermogemmatispora sp.]|jgi:hypothetical protein|uniref:hypothetical protein n=1 Tax=Thermogemmatispora sp. TaxID=1968838 RepID=UPI0035E43D44